MEDKLIKELLEDVKYNKLKTLKEIEEDKKIIMDNLYDKYEYYNINEKNKKNTYDLLKNYKYVECDELLRGDYIRYINDKYFYNITLMKGGFIMKMDEDKIEIMNNNIYNKINKRDYIIFKKITKEENIKLLILDNLDV